MHLVLQCISCTWLVLNLVLASDHSLKPLDSCKPGLLVRKSEPGKKWLKSGEVTICQKSLDAASASEKQFFHGIKDSWSVQSKTFKIDGYTRIGQTFQHHDIQINPSAGVYEIAQRKWLTMQWPLHWRGKGAHGEIPLSHSFWSSHRKKKYRGKSTFFHLFRNCYKIICYAMSLHSSFSGFQMKVVSE